jgi:hypothetical protein
MSEHERAKAWREHHQLSQTQLGELVGYSQSAITWFEAGLTPPRTYHGKKSPERKGRKIHPTVWLRYKAACAGIDAWLRDKRRFDW